MKILEDRKKLAKLVFEILEKKYTKELLTELDYINNYTLLISVLLSAQATDERVNKVTKELFEKVKTPKEMILLGEKQLKEYIKSINYFNTKAKNIINLSKILVEKFDSEVPSNREDLEILPGIGRKTANIILNISFNQPTIAVDTHVFRVSNRIGLVATKNVLDTEIELYKIIPNKYIQFTNHWLVLLGRYICKARKPKCDECPLEKICEKNLQ